MMIPDKIYVPVDKMFDDVIYNEWTSAKINKSVEYIRKDALLDYFRQRVEELKSPLNGVFGSTEREHCNERISELLLLIDKLNEM